MLYNIYQFLQYKDSSELLYKLFAKNTMGLTSSQEQYCTANVTEKKQRLSMPSANSKILNAYPRETTAGYDDMFDSKCVRISVNKGKGLQHFEPKSHPTSMTDTGRLVDWTPDSMNADNTRANKFMPTREVQARSNPTTNNTTHMSRFTSNELFGKGSDDSVSKHVMHGRDKFKTYNFVPRM
jgi:hypothetical protein